MADDVRLTDLEVIAQFSLAVRGPVASRAAVVAALRSDLAWLTGEEQEAAAPPARRASAVPQVRTGPQAPPGRQATPGPQAPIGPQVRPGPQAPTGPQVTAGRRMPTEPRVPAGAARVPTGPQAPGAPLVPVAPPARSRAVPADRVPRRATVEAGPAPELSADPPRPTPRRVPVRRPVRRSGT